MDDYWTKKEASDNVNYEYELMMRFVTLYFPYVIDRCAGFEVCRRVT